MNPFDGNLILRNLTKKAGYRSISEVIAENTLYTHPDTVMQTQNKNLFRIIRNASKRGTIVDIEDGQAMYCDNEGPNRAFTWSNGGFKYKDVQFNHIYSDSQNIDIYTSLANICVTPAFLAKLTDTDDEIKQLLKYRAYDLYGFYQEHVPTKPVDYDNLKWLPFLPPVKNLEEYLLKRMNRSKKSRSSKSARQIGWYFNDFKPDERIAE